MEEPRALPPKKSGAKTVLWVLAGIFGLFLLVVALASIFVARWLNDPKNQQMLDAAKGGLKAAVEGSQAPGAEQLRNLGCKRAVIISSNALMEAYGSVAKDEEAKSAGRELGETPMVMCLLGADRGLDCDQVARTYLVALEQRPQSFLVMVQEQSLGGGEPKCMGMYNDQGQLVRALDAEDMD